MLREVLTGQLCLDALILFLEMCDSGTEGLDDGFDEFKDFLMLH